MLNFLDINFDGKILRGIEHVNINNKMCVSFVHGIPGDRIIFFLGFSDSAKILLKFANSHKDIILILCNGMIDNSDAKEYLPIKKACRVKGCFAVDSNCGLWYNVKLFKEKIVFDLEKLINEKRIYFIYGNDDVLCKSSLKYVSKAGGEILVVDKGDHLFTNKYAEDILQEKIDWIIKNIRE